MAHSHTQRRVPIPLPATGTHPWSGYSSQLGLASVQVSVPVLLQCELATPYNCSHREIPRNRDLYPYPSPCMWTSHYIELSQGHNIAVIAIVAAQRSSFGKPPEMVEVWICINIYKFKINVNFLMTGNAGKLHHLYQRRAFVHLREVKNKLIWIKVFSSEKRFQVTSILPHYFQNQFIFKSTLDYVVLFQYLQCCAWQNKMMTELHITFYCYTFLPGNNKKSSRLHIICRRVAVGISSDFEGWLRQNSRLNMGLVAQREMWSACSGRLGKSLASVLLLIA